MILRLKIPQRLLSRQVHQVRIIRHLADFKRFPRRLDVARPGCR